MRSIVVVTLLLGSLALARSAHAATLSVSATAPSNCVMTCNASITFATGDSLAACSGQSSSTPICTVFNCGTGMTIASGPMTQNGSNSQWIYYWNNETTFYASVGFKVDLCYKDQSGVLHTLTGYSSCQLVDNGYHQTAASSTVTMPANNACLTLNAQYMDNANYSVTYQKHSSCGTWNPIYRAHLKDNVVGSTWTSDVEWPVGPGSGAYNAQGNIGSVNVPTSILNNKVAIQSWVEYPKGTGNQLGYNAVQVCVQTTCSGGCPS